MADWKQETFSLEYPITVDGITIGQVTVREPDLEAMEAIEDLNLTSDSRMLLDDDGRPMKNAAGQKLYKDPTFRDMRRLIGVMSDLPASHIGKMHRNDFGKVAGVIVPLLNGPESAPDAAQGPDGSKA